MKTIVTGKMLTEKIQESIQKLCGSVKYTLGPQGCNVLISSSKLSPYMTNDGVTIARNIESDDPIIDAILEIAKESSLKTNELVGDGTTTTLVLLESMMEKGFSLLEKGYQPMTLKKEMEKCLDKLLDQISKETKEASETDYLEVAKSSANDLELGKLAFEVFQKIGRKSGIQIEESETERTTYELLKGYSLEADVKKELLECTFLKNVSILLIDGELESLEEISEILNQVIKEKRNCLILADSYLEEIKNEMLSYSMDQENKIILLETPEYGTRRLEILKDIECITESQIWHKKIGEVPSVNHLGYQKEINFYKDMIVFPFKENKKIQKRRQMLEKQEWISEYEKTFLEERYAKLKNGLAMIYVGGISKTSKREKLMRLEDALCALECTKEGVIPGSCFTLFEIGEKYKKNTKGEEVVVSSLKVPIFQVLLNSGLDAGSICDQIKKQDFKIVYNVKENNYETKEETSIKDPVEVVKTSLKNAVSIASMLLTTSHLVINERKKEEQEL